MARGVKRPLSEKIAAQKEIIERKAAELKVAKAKLVELEKQEREELIMKLKKAADESGQSMDDLIKKALEQAK